MKNTTKTYMIRKGHLDCDSVSEGGFSCALESVGKDGNVFLENIGLDTMSIDRIKIPGDLVRFVSMDIAHPSRLVAIDLENATCKVTYRGDDENDPKSIACSKTSA